MVFPVCHKPWTTINVTQDGDVTPCCHNLKAGKFGNILKDEIDVIWNGPQYLFLRESLARGVVKGTGCEGCRELAIRRDSMSRNQNAPSMEGATQTARDHRCLENESRVWREFNAGTACMKALPTNLEYFQSSKCNLNCDFCFQMHQKKMSLGEPGYALLRKLSPYLRHISWVGGEPTMQSHFYRWLREFPSFDNPYLGISIVTNGTNFNRSLNERLLEVGQCSILISLDACDADLYEQIRINATWKRTLANLMELLSIRDSRPNFQVGTSFLWQKRNFAHLPAYLAFCRELGLPTNVNPIDAFPLPSRIDLFSDIDSDIPADYERIIEASIREARLLDERIKELYAEYPTNFPMKGLTESFLTTCVRSFRRGEVRARTHTERIVRALPRDSGIQMAVARQNGRPVSYALVNEAGEIAMRVPPGEIELHFFGDRYEWDQKGFESMNFRWLPFVPTEDGWASLAGRRVGIWGAGGCYRQYLEGGVQANRDIFADIFLVDRDEGKWGVEMAGIPVMAPSALVEEEVDVVLIASTFVNDIVPQIEALGFRGECLYVKQ